MQLPELFGDQVGVEGGVAPDRAGDGHGSGMDAFVVELFAQGAHQGPQGGFANGERGLVGLGVQGQAAPGKEQGALAAREHAGDDQLGCQQSPVKVDLEGLLEGLPAQLRGPAALGGVGVVHQYLDGAKRFFGLTDGGDELGGAGYVGRKGLNRATIEFQCPCVVLQAGHTAGDQAQPVPLAAKAPGHREPEAPPHSNHQAGFRLHIAHGNIKNAVCGLA